MKKCKLYNADGDSSEWLTMLGLLFLSCVSPSICGGCQNQTKPFPESTQQRGKEQSMSEKLRGDFIVAKGKSRKEWLHAKDQWVAELRRRYRGIDVSAKAADAMEHSRRFGELMREWKPIHGSVEDLKSIVGQPMRETPDSLDYSFAAGPAPSVWRFKIQGGIIVGLEYFPGE